MKMSSQCDWNSRLKYSIALLWPYLNTDRNDSVITGEQFACQMTRSTDQDSNELKICILFTVISLKQTGAVNFTLFYKK